MGRPDDAELIASFEKRTNGWALNDDAAWVKVKLGEMRAVLRAIEAAAIRQRKGA